MTATWLLWAFLCTLLLTSAMAGAQGAGLTRISMPFILGMIFTPNRDRAKLYGFVFHLGNGLLFSLLYLTIFLVLGRSTWWIGALFGLGHAAFVLLAVLPLLPTFHPRMASEEHGPEAKPELEPPGFAGLNYGGQTPLTVIVAHLLYGAGLGSLVHVVG